MFVSISRPAAIALFCSLATLGLPPQASAAPLAAPHPTHVNWNLSAAQIAQNCASVLGTVDSRIKAIIAQRGPRTFGNTLSPLEAAGADLNDRLVAETLLFSVSPDRAVRDASLKCGTQQSDYFTEMSARPDLYAALVSVQKSKTAKTTAQKKLLTLWMTSLRRSGAGLAPAQRSEFISLEKKLTDLQNRFAENLANDASTITISVSQATSLPADFIAGLKRTAEGGYIVPVNESTTTPFMQNEKDADARKAFYLAYNNRAPANVALLQEAIATRDRLAHLMGYQTWAAYVLADRMAASPQRVLKFLDDLDAKLLPKARQDLAGLAALKAQDTGNSNATIEAWDVTYYDNQLNKTRYAVDNNAIRRYFPVQHTIDSILNLYHKLLGVTFVQERNPDVWVPDVLAYDVYDTRTGRYIGTSMFDLYPRPGKYNHFANFPLLPVRQLANGTWRPPISAIIGNWPRPAPGHPALLSHDDVVTFFHEFGHNLAAMLTTAPYETLSTGFRQDFVEAPSQMLENFMWQPSILKEVSSNVDTGQPLPDDLIAKMVAARYVDNAYFTTRQILLATVDMDYHSMGPILDTTAVWAKVAREETPLPMAEGIHPQASFGHLMGGYDAGYYGYLWSKVYAQDMFTAFQKGGLENPAVGMRYRRDILEPARTIEPDAEVAAFLGRPMSPNAFYSEFGIAVHRNSP